MSGDENYQWLWDAMLLDYWKKGFALLRLVDNFCEVMGVLEGAPLEEKCAYIRGLGLKRLPKDYFPPTSVRSFVGMYCQKLNACLFNKKNDIHEIYQALDLFKWRKSCDSRKYNHHSRDKKRRRETRFIGARTKNKYDWGTTR